MTLENASLRAKVEAGVVSDKILRKQLVDNEVKNSGCILYSVAGTKHFV